MAFMMWTLQFALLLSNGVLGFSWGGTKGKGSESQFTTVIQNTYVR